MNEDAQLVKNVKNNSSEFDKLYVKYYRSVFNYFWYRTRHDSDVSEDLTQEVFVKAFEHIKDYEDRGFSYLTYLLKIAHNLLVNYYRKPQPLPLEEAGDPPAEVIDNSEDEEAIALLWNAVQQLRVQDRDVILMKYSRDLSIKEISVITGKSENAVKLLLSRARKKLARHKSLELMQFFSSKKRTLPQSKFHNDEL